MGVAALAAGAGLAFALVASGAPWWTRAVVFFPVWLAALGLLQAREQTCVARRRVSHARRARLPHYLKDEGGRMKDEDKAQ
jgi:hypothetical protein